MRCINSISMLTERIFDGTSYTRTDTSRDPFPMTVSQPSDQGQAKAQVSEGQGKERVKDIGPQGIQIILNGREQGASARSFEKFFGHGKQGTQQQLKKGSAD